MCKLQSVLLWSSFLAHRLPLRQLAYNLPRWTFRKIDQQLMARIRIAKEEKRKFFNTKWQRATLRNAAAHPCERLAKRRPEERGSCELRGGSLGRSSRNTFLSVLKSEQIDSKLTRFDENLFRIPKRVKRRRWKTKMMKILAGDGR